MRAYTRCPVRLAPKRPLESARATYGDDARDDLSRHAGMGVTTHIVHTGVLERVDVADTRRQRDIECLLARLAIFDVDVMQLLVAVQELCSMARSHEKN